jgi:hypothetical protein
MIPKEVPIQDGATMHCYTRLLLRPGRTYEQAETSAVYPVGISQIVKL